MKAIIDAINISVEAMNDEVFQFFTNKYVLALIVFFIIFEAWKMSLYN